LTEDDVISSVKEEMLGVVSRNKKRPSVMARRIFFENLLPGNPLGGPLLGTEESLASIQPDDLRAFHRRYFAPDNLILSMVGNASIEEMKAWTEETWGRRAGREKPAEAAARPAPPRIAREGKRIEEQAGQAQSSILIGSAIRVKDDELPAVYAMNGILSERLAFNLREKQGLAYSIGSRVHLASGGEEPWGWILVSMGTRPENVEKAEKGILEEMRRLRARAPDEGELKKAVSRYAGKGLRRQLPSIGRAYRLGLEAYFGWESGAFLRRVDEMKKLKPEDIQRAARKVLEPDRMLVVIAR
jgi:predicted Zn-dependent peptidase